MTRIFFIGFLAALSAAMAQTTTKPVGGSTSPTTPTTSPLPSRTPTTSTTTTNPSTDPSIARVVFISGKVVMQDGTPPPESVSIERNCGNFRRIETHTDLKGNFSFQLGAGMRSSDQMMDASNDSIGSRGGFGSPTSSSNGSLGNVSGGRQDSSTNLRGCELKAVLPGYSSSAVNLTMHSQFDSPDIGIVILKRLAGREGDTISMTNALAPKDAKKAYDKSRQLVAKGNVADAQKELSKAVGIYPKYASAWAELGRLQMDANDLATARNSFEKSLEADPKYLPPYERLSVLALRERNWNELVDRTDKLLKLNGFDYPQAYYYSALAHLNLGHGEEAEKGARQALKQDPQKFVRAYYVLGLALATKGEFAAAAEQLKTYVASEPGITEIDTVRKQLADIEKRATMQQARDEKEQQPQ